MIFFINMRTLVIALSLILVSGFLSCNKILMNAYGIKEPRFMNKEQVLNQSNKLGIPGEQSFILNKKYFLDLEKKDTGNALIFSNKCSPMISKYEQPLQVMYFNETGQLVSFHNNCYAPGFPKLKWNSNGQFDKFIPATTIPLTDSVLNLHLLLKHLEPLTGNNVSPGSQIIVIVFWSNFMLKQSKELIKVTRNNLHLDKKNESKILFVNTDNCFVDDRYATQINKTG